MEPYKLENLSNSKTSISRKKCISLEFSSIFHCLKFAFLSYTMAKN